MIHLIVGNTGAGKTTYAQDLSTKVRGVVFSIDKWNNTLFLPDKQPEDGLDWFLERIEREEAIILDLVAQMEALGVDTILDLGFSKYTHREKFRALAREHGWKTRLHFLDIPQDVRRKRVHKRNTEKGASYEFEVTDENFAFMEGWFETPTEAELIDAVHIQ